MGLLTWLGLRRSNQWEPPTLLDHLLLSPLTLLATKFHRLVSLLRGQPSRLPRKKPAIRVVCISDTHDRQVAIPAGDILIHAGDLTDSGTAADIQKQLDWLRAQAHPLKVVVAGNHDSYFDPSSRLPADVKSGVDLDLDGLVYLESDLAVREINGRSVSIFGVPDIPECGPQSFAQVPAAPMEKAGSVHRFQYSPINNPWFSKIPPQTDILVTHCPPKHHLDLGLGDPVLLGEVWRVKPLLHVFGHVHWGHGSESIFFDDMQRAYERLLSRRPRGVFWDFVPNPAWGDMVRILGYGFLILMGKWILGAESSRGTILVNAAQMHGNTGRAKNRAVVIDI